MSWTISYGWPLQPLMTRQQAGSCLMSMLVPGPWASLTTISVAPASMAARQQARTSRVISSAWYGYSLSDGQVSGHLAVVAIPSMSALM